MVQQSMVHCDDVTQPGFAFYHHRGATDEWPFFMSRSFSMPCACWIASILIFPPPTHPEAPLIAVRMRHLAVRSDVPTMYVLNAIQC